MNRNRDIAIVAGLAALVVAALAAASGAPLAYAGLAVAALAALALAYARLTASRLTASRLTGGRDAARDSGAAAAGAPPATPAPAAPPREDVASSMIERLPDPVLLIGPGGRIERANAAARTFFGLSREPANIAAVLRQPEVLDAASAALRGEQPMPVEHHARTPYEMFVKVFAAPLPAGPEGRASAILVLHDETDLRRAEQMRAKFLANASHELRTPLASLAGFIETLRGHAKDDPEARERFLEIMHGQAGRMSRLINDLLSLSRIEMSEHLPPSDVVDLAIVARDAADALRPIADARGAAIVLSAPEGGAPVTGDRDQLAAVVQNLVDNALKYSPRGGAVRLEVIPGLSPAEAMRPPASLGPAPGRFTIVAPAGEGPVTAVRITDEGPGIEAAHLPSLSQRFYRVEEGKAEDRKGTGLGLAIVKHVMTRHRGGFAVESQPGRGTVFTVCAPVSAGARAS